MSRTVNIARSEGPQPDKLDVSRITATEEWEVVMVELRKQHATATERCCRAPDFATKQFYFGMREMLEQLITLSQWDIWKPAPEPAPEREYIREVPA